MPIDENRLAPIVARIEEGAFLSDQEIELVREAAFSQPDKVDWMLCLGHALVNSERPAEGLKAFERAEQRLPHEVLVRVGKARALAALERYPEAEAELRMALKIHPAHADALRALALLRLRAGAAGEAIRLLEKVLEVDPIDEESKQILAEAKAVQAAGGDAVQLEPSQPSSRAESRETFVEALQKALAARGLQSRTDPSHSVLVVKIGGGRDARLSLSSLYENYAAGDRSLDETIEAIVGGILQMKEPGKLPLFEEVRDRIFPVIRPAKFLTQSGPTLSTEAPGGLLLIFVIDYPDFVSYLPPDAVEKWGKSLEEIATLAFANLEREPHEPTRYAVGPQGLEEVSGDAWDLLAFDSGDGYDGARLYSKVHREKLAELSPGPWIVAMPSRAYSLIARKDDQRAIGYIKALVKDEAGTAQAVSGELYLLQADGELARAAGLEEAKA